MGLPKASRSGLVERMASESALSLPGRRGGGEMRGDAGRCAEMCGDVRRCAEMQGRWDGFGARARLAWAYAVMGIRGDGRRGRGRARVGSGSGVR